MSKVLLFIMMIVIITLTGCKKYPENKFPILLVPPEVVLKQLSGAHLKSYLVNGIDSMDVMEKVYPGAKNAIFRYGVLSLPRSSSNYRNYSWEDGTSGFFNLGFLYFSDDRMYLSSGNAPFNINKIYTWKIIKLTKKELKVKAQKNNNIYELHFKK